MNRWRLFRKSSLGDVVWLSAMTASLGEAEVITDQRYLSLVRRFRGVVASQAWPGSPGGRIADLDGRCPWPAEVRWKSQSIRRQLWKWGIIAPRPHLLQSYAKTLGIQTVPQPWIDLPDYPRDTLIVIPGASRQSKCWSSNQFRDLVKRWDRPVIVVGSSEERALVQWVAGEKPAIAEDGFEQTLEAMARARVVVGGDTGLLHLGGAGGAKVVGLFGPTHPDDGFFCHDGRVVQQSLACRPCSVVGPVSCPLKHHQCMNFSVDEVEAAIEAEWHRI